MKITNFAEINGIHPLRAYEHDGFTLPEPRLSRC